jgi:uroporphyrinogen decarboxylase
MRQAGRYMPESRALRERHPFLEMVKTPELACEVTLQPIKAFDLDAAIIFADILPPLEGMGLHLTFAAGDGPMIHNPVRSKEDVEALTVRTPEETLGFTLEAIRLARRELDGRGIPLIGFSGAPFTLAAYAIEGSGSANHAIAKTFMMAEPEAWRRLMDRLSQVVGEYMLAQAAAGAHALQLFDSWVGQLSPADYREYALPYSQRSLQIARRAGVPIIHFGTNTGGMLDMIAEAGGDVIGVDWRLTLDEAWRKLGPSVAVQGNLDPVALLAPWDEVQKRAGQVLDSAAGVGLPGHIFNLGHGILQGTPVDNVARLADYVHERTSRG